jgi:glycerol kinase
LSADGGASQNDDLMQYQADILAVPVNRGDLAEVSAVGAMLMAASAMGKAVTPAEGTPRLFMPASSEASRTAALRQWREAVQRTLWSSSNN